MERNYFREDAALGLLTLTIEKGAEAELEALIGSAFAGAAVARAALLVLVGEGCDFAEVARLLRPAMLRPVPFRPAAVSVAIHPDNLSAARALSLELAWSAVVLSASADPLRAEARALQERRLVLLEGGDPSSNTSSVAPIRAEASFRRSSLRASRRSASASVRGFSRAPLN